MAQILTTYDFDKPKAKPPKPEGPRRVYPWGEWFDGRIWRIFQGTDFDIPPLMMERVIRTRASAKHFRVQVRHDEDGSIVFQSNVGGGRLPARAQARRIHRPRELGRGAEVA